MLAKTQIKNNYPKEIKWNLNTFIFKEIFV